MAMTVLVVDDHPGFRACARRALEEEGYEVVGEATDGPSAVSCASKLHPELALVDVHLVGTDGFDVAARLAELGGDAPAVILISSHDRSEIEPLVAGSGARGFVPKDELSREAIQGLL